MTLVVCLDDHNGMAFNERRQSMDAVLRSRMIERIGQHNLWMSRYSANQFKDIPENVIVDEDFLNKAVTGEACFVELQDPSDCLQWCKRLIVYRWNRSYPADVFFQLQKHEDKLQLLNREDFVGSAHEQITEEIYEIV